MSIAVLFLLENLKIVTTTLMFRFVMKRELSHRQWTAVAILTAGSVLHSVSALQSASVSLSDVHCSLFGLFLLCCSCSISAFASVFTEYLLKTDNGLSVFHQNSLIYIFGVFFNAILWVVEVRKKNNAAESKYSFSLLDGFSIYTYTLVLTQVTLGLVMSLILKYLSNMAKVFIVASAPLVTTVLAYVIFDLHIQLEFMFSGTMVCIAVVLYNYPAAVDRGHLSLATSK